MSLSWETYSGRGRPPKHLGERTHKHCPLCNTIKPLGEFYKRKNGKTPQTYCRSCNSKVVSAWAKAKRDHIRGHAVRRLTADEVRDKRRQYVQNNRQKIRDYQKAYRRANLNARLAHCLRSRLNDALKRKPKRGSAVKLLGCSVDQAIRHIEAQFLPGMSWENWGAWHVDHITPLAWFDLTDARQLASACHYTNLQPLWQSENQRKGARI